MTAHTSRLVMRPMRRAARAAGVVAVVLASAAPGASAAEPTQRLRYSPFTAGGAANPALRVTPGFGGECNSASWLVTGNAYRCFHGHFLRDPCYFDAVASERAERDIVLCVPFPWSRSAVRLRADTLEPSSPRAAGGPPWALALANGSRCGFATGASTAVDGRRLNYFCGRSRYLFGSPDTSRSVWRIRMSRDPYGAGMRKVAIRRAWR
jgi:hypothetical protein